MISWKVEDLPITVDSVLRGQGADPEIMKVRSPRLLSLAEKALEEGLKLLKPAVLSRQLQVEQVRHDHLVLEGGFKLSGEIVTRHLASAESVIAVICTVGPDLENFASRVSDNNLTFGMALDGVGSAGVEALAQAVCSQLEHENLKKGLHTTIPLSPGMVGWPVDEGQPILFEILEPGKIGVALNSHFMMIPRKAVSMLIGVGKEMNNTGNPCDYCSMNLTCRYQDQYRQAVKK